MHEWNNKRAELIHPDDSERSVLEQQLRTLGMVVRLTWPIPDYIQAETNALLVRVTQSNQIQAAGILERFSGIALAIVDPDSAAIIRTLTGCNLHGVLVRPHGRGTLFAQLSVAAAVHGYVGKLQARVAHLESNLRARRVIEKATQMLIAGSQMSEDDAYEMLRNEAMKKRVAVGRVAQDVVSSADPDRFRGLVAMPRPTSAE